MSITVRTRRRKVSVDGNVLNEVVTRIEQTGDRAIRGALDEMRSEAEEIQQLARQFAPVDTEGLEDSISVDEDRSGVNRRTVLLVYIDGTHMAGDGTQIGKYAHYIHESPGYNLGPKSLEKSARLGGGVGPKFLQRAAAERGPFLRKAIAERVKRAIRSRQ